MTYKTGDTVWYIDNTPRIRKDVIRGVFQEPERYTLQFGGGYYYDNQFKLFTTKEALLAAIDPPSYNFVVGQTVWYVENDEGVDILRINKYTVTAITHDSVTVCPRGIISFTLDGADLDLLFASVQDAVNKALELKQW